MQIIGLVRFYDGNIPLPLEQVGLLDPALSIAPYLAIGLTPKTKPNAKTEPVSILYSLSQASSDQLPDYSYATNVPA